MPAGRCRSPSGSGSSWQRPCCTGTWSEEMASNPAHNPPGRQPGRYAYGGLERLLHERARLSILASLANHAGGLLFGDLKSLCSLTDGNLSRQLQVLQEAGLVEVWKGFK